MPKDFLELDNAIARFLDGRPTCHPLYSQELNAVARRFDDDPYRLIDRRLQALRKKGVIYLDRKAKAGWRVVVETL